MDRRHFLGLVPAALAAAGADVPAQSKPSNRGVLARGNEALPLIGMGTWLTFDIGDDEAERMQRRLVLERFFSAGGGMIDSSPMYGRAEARLGELLASLPHESRLFAATKVWTPFDQLGPRQIEKSQKLWRVPRFDAVLVHNLLDWSAHLKMLRQRKDEGRVRYIGVSTSHGSRHDEAERVIRNEALDVLQITYNFSDTRAEPLMDLAAERGVAVVINRPFDGGGLFSRVGKRPLPAWAGEIDCANWAQFFLKWVVAHPAVTCAIPATRNPAHMDENMGARIGRMPDAALRARMQSHIGSL